jgi:hypothetical protein
MVLKLHSEYLKKETIEGLGVFKIGRQVIGTVKCADYFVLLLQGVTDRLIKIGRCCGN